MPHSARQAAGISGPRLRGMTALTAPAGPSPSSSHGTARRLPSASQHPRAAQRGRMRVCRHRTGRRADLAVALSLRHSQSCLRRDRAWLLPGAHGDRTGSQDPTTPGSRPLGQGPAPTIPAFLDFPCQLNGTRGPGGHRTQHASGRNRGAGHQQGQQPPPAAHWPRRHVAEAAVLSVQAVVPTHTPAGALRVRGLHAVRPPHLTWQTRAFSRGAGAAW